MLKRITSCFIQLFNEFSFFSLFGNYYGLIFERILATSTFLIVGKIENSDSLVKTLFFGTERLAHQFAYLTYCKIVCLKSVGKYRFQNLLYSNFKNFNIIVMNGNSHVLNKFLNSGYFLLPNIDFVLDLGESLDKILEKMSRRRRRDLRKMRENNYVINISRNCLVDFNFFYLRLYLPYTKKRFGKGAVISSYIELKKMYKKNGGIVFVKEGDQNIVGLLFGVKNKVVYAKGLGVIRGDQKYVRSLAGQAALFYLIDWARSKRFDKLNYGTTMPFFLNGIFSYKKECGMHIEKHRVQPYIILKPNHLSVETLSFLQYNPFIFIDKNLMKGLVFINYRPTIKDLKKLFSDYFLSKLNSIIFIAYFHQDNKLKSIIDNYSGLVISQKNLNLPLSAICVSLQKSGYIVEVYELK